MLARVLRHLGVGRLPRSEWFANSGARDARHGVELTYLGVAGFVLRANGHSIALDPYVTRHGITQLLWRPLVSDAARLARWVPHAHDVFVGHAHYDHVLDAPALCARTGARLIGSRAVCMVGRAAGLPEAKLVETAGREDITSGAFVVRGLPSLHGKVFRDRVLFPGDIEAPPAWPPRAAELRHGLVLNWHVRTSGFSLVHVDSADFVADELRGTSADVVCLCAAGWRARRGYVAEIVRLLKPRFVVPCHWDTMITPLEAPARLLPGVDLEGMLREILRAGVQPLLLPLLGHWSF
jgi:L-ascorbate metabolism protein UlaG (beta-lactamase superfamily)